MSNSKDFIDLISNVAVIKTELIALKESNAKSWETHDKNSKIRWESLREEQDIRNDGFSEYAKLTSEQFNNIINQIALINDFHTKQVVLNNISTTHIEEEKENRKLSSGQRFGLLVVLITFIGNIFFVWLNYKIYKKNNNVEVHSEHKID